MYTEAFGRASYLVSRSRGKKSTVSKALSGATDISEKTRERILGCASEMGYQVKTGRTAYSRNLIVFIYGSIHYDKVDQFGYEIILGIQAAAAEQGIGVNIVAINDEELKTGSYYSIMSGGNYEGSEFLGSQAGEFPYIRGTRNSNDWRIHQTLTVDSAAKANAEALKILNAGVDAIGFHFTS